MSDTNSTSAAETNPQNGQHEAQPDWTRAAKGRFAAGNRGGPGNPFARRTAKLRQAFCEAITEEEMTQLSRTLYERALNGDNGAARLVLAYMLGKPDVVVNPDTLDAQEWDNCKEHFISPQVLPELLQLFPKDILIEVAKTAMPTLVRERCARLAKLIDNPNSEQSEDPVPPCDEQECVVADPATNGPAPVTAGNGNAHKAAKGTSTKRRYQSGSNGGTTARNRQSKSTARTVNGAPKKPRVQVPPKPKRTARQPQPEAPNGGAEPVSVNRISKYTRARRGQSNQRARPGPKCDT